MLTARKIALVLVAMAASTSTSGWLGLFPSTLEAQEKPSDSARGKAASEESANPQPATAIYPLDVVLAKDGAAIVVDRNLPGLWKRQDEKLSVWVQGTKRFRQPLNAPRCVAIDKDGSILVGDSATREIYRIGDDGKPQPLTGGAIGIPMEIAVRADGSLMVADLETHALRKVSTDGKQIQSIARVNPRGVFVDAQDKVWVVSQDPQQLQVVDDNGKSTAIVEKRTFEFAHQVVVNSRGEAFVSDGYKKAIWRVKPGAAPEVYFSGPPLDNPVGLLLDGDDLIVTDPRARQLFRIVDGKCQKWFGW